MTRGRLAAAAVACAATAAIALPGSPPGLGVFVVAAMIALVVVVARPSPISWDSGVCALLALALVAMAVVRDAGWIVGIDLLAAACLGSLAIAGGRTWGGIIRGGGAAGGAIHRGLAFVAEPARSVASRTFRGRPEGLVRGVAIGSGLLLVFGALFASADRAFVQLASRVLAPDIHASLLPARIYLFVFIAALTGAYIVIGPRYAPAGAGAEHDLPVPPPARPLGTFEWGISLGLLNALFAGFVGVQMAVLFGGRHHVLDTVGLSYAQYARQGFFQLVAVAVLVMVVIAAAVRWARADSVPQRVVLRLLLGLLCLLTLVILASALKRLTLYEDTYGFTRLRVSVHAVILWLGLLFTLLLAAGVAWRGRWLPRAFVYSTAAALLVFSLVNPEGLIAEQNVERFEATGSIDLFYLRELSDDAVPALTGLRPDLRACLFDAMDAGGAGTGWAGFNLARRRAAEVTAQAEPTGGFCSPSGTRVGR